MVNIFRKLFVKNYNDVDNPKVREAHGKLATIVGIISNFILFFAKLLIGLVAGAYSSIFMSASIWVYFENKLNIKKNTKNKTKKKDTKPKKRKVEELSVKGINA